jgi:cell division protein FtsB
MMVQFKPVYFKIGLVLGVLILIGYVSLIFIGKNGLGDLNAMKQELQNINIKNEEIRQENVEIYRKIERLKTDPVYMENIAREELKMIGEKEMVFKFDDAKQPKTDSAPPTPNTPPLTPGTASPEPVPITPLEPPPPPENTGPSPQD